MLEDDFLQQVTFYDAVHVNRCRFLNGPPLAAPVPKSRQRP